MPNKILAVGLNYRKHIDEAKEVSEHHSENVEPQEQSQIYLINRTHQLMTHM